MEIKLLDENTIQKIAAGEVIESPISIVKELVENSIDAESTSISVEIKKGGKELILVKDNGKGIDSDQIENAFLRHSTSKIQNFDDLYKINSLGFRGEALASIVAVAKVKASSRTEDETSGVEVYYENSILLDKIKVGMNVGTSMEIRDLFHNIPVRRNFLESDITESNRITRLMYSLAIGNYDISFRYIKDDREIFKTNGDGLKNVLLDGSLEVDNNAAERAIKPFVIGRKNFLFANTAKGATASSNIYSIVETAKANNLVVERYLVYLFDNLSKIDIYDSESLENLMPWNDKIPENMKIKDSGINNT